MWTRRDSMDYDKLIKEKQEEMSKMNAQYNQLGLQRDQVGKDIMELSGAIKQLQELEQLDKKK